MVIKKCKEKFRGVGVGRLRIEPVKFRKLMFADDMVLIVDIEITLQQNILTYQGKNKENEHGNKSTLYRSKSITKVTKGILPRNHHR